MKNSFLILLSMVFGTLALTSCGDKHNDTPEVFDGIYYQEGTPDREYFEMVANTVLGFVKPSAQQEAITALNVFTQYCEYDFPDEFKGQTDMSRAVADIIDNIDNCDFAGVSRAFTTYAFNYAQFKGLYQADSESRRWFRIESRDNLDFKYYNGTKEYNIILTGQGDSWTISHETSDASYRIDVPKVIDIVVSTGANTSPRTLITAKIQSEFKDGASLLVKSSVRFADIQIESTVNASDSRINNDITVYEHDPSSYVRTLITQSTATINGRNLCSSSAWRSLESAGDPVAQLAGMFTDASMTMMIYKSVQIKGTVKNLQTVMENSGSWWSDEVSNPRAAAEKAASALQSCITAELRYCSDAEQKLRGTMGWQPYVCDDWYDGEAWSVRPTLTFTSDNATYDFSSFFGEKRFQTIENTINGILRSYISFWK